MLPYVSLVFAWDPTAGVHATWHFIATLRRHHAALSAAIVPYQVIVVEWCREPVAGGIGQAVRAALPGLAGHLVVYQVDSAYHEAFNQNPSLRFPEFIARNAGIRRATGSYVLAADVDAPLTDDVVELLAHRALSPMLLYQVRGGLLLDRFSWHRLRGFNEVYRVNTAAASPSFTLRARAAGVQPVALGRPIARSEAVLPWERVSWRNPPEWGLGGALELKRGAGDYRLAYDASAVPPLVALGSLSREAALTRSGRT